MTGTLTVTDGDLDGSVARVPGDIVVEGLGSVSAAGIFLGGTLSGAGLPAFSPVTTTFNGAGQTIPAAPAYQTVIVGEGTTLATAGFVGDATISGDVVISGPAGTQLSLGSNVVTVLGNLSTTFGGVLVMQSQTGVLFVDGDAVFAGASTGPFLTTGVLEIGGDFGQFGPATGSFFASGNHTVVLNGLAGTVQNVSFTDPAVSHFQNLDVTGAVNGVRIASNVEVAGIFTSVPAPGANTILDATGGGGFTFQVGEVDVDGLTLDNRVLFRYWTTNSSALANFDNVTFGSYGLSDLQFWVQHPGVPLGGTLDFKDIRFQTLLDLGPPPDAGLYIRVEDDGSGDQLTVNLNRATPIPEPPTTQNGDAFTDLQGGAQRGRTSLLLTRRVGLGVAPLLLTRQGRIGWGLRTGWVGARPGGASPAGSPRL